MLRFPNVTEQLKARDAVNEHFKDQYVTALSFASRAPEIFGRVGLDPCRLAWICVVACICCTRLTSTVPSANSWRVCTGRSPGAVGGQHSVQGSRRCDDWQQRDNT